MIKRHIANKIIERTREYPVVLITGPRQSGKTTLVKSLFPERTYTNLEDLETRDFALNDAKGFLTSNDGELIIDEVQRVPQLLSYIQGKVDTEKRNGQYILTGSQNLLLMEQVTQSLAGRVAIINLLPLSMEELKETEEILKNPEYFIFKGFYPKLYNESIKIREYYLDYIQTYVERDVRLIKKIIDLNTFQRFLKMCAARSGQLLNMSSLADDCGISHNTVKEWISVLEASFVIFLLQPYYQNFNKRLIKMPKLYFYDTGLLCALLNIEKTDQLLTFPLRGQIFENFIIVEIFKFQYNQGLPPYCYFWRNKTGKEIDLIIESAQQLKLIEIKSGQTISEDYFKNLKYFQKIAENVSTQSFVIYAGTGIQQRSNETVVGWKQAISSIFN